MKMAWTAAAAGMMLAAALTAQAQDFRKGGIAIEHAWARPSAGANRLGAAYLTVKNGGVEADTLQSASSPEAERVEIHEHIADANGVMRMRAVEGGLKIPAGATVEFQPGGNHLMLIGLKHDLEEGKSFPLKLNFARAGEVDVQVDIGKSSGGK